MTLEVLNSFYDVLNLKKSIDLSLWLDGLLILELWHQVLLSCSCGFIVFPIIVGSVNLPLYCLVRKFLG